MEGSEDTPTSEAAPTAAAGTVKPEALKDSSLRSRVRHAFEAQAHPGIRWFLGFIQILIVLSIAAFTIETLPTLSPATRQLLHGFEAFAIGIFTAEYLLRLWMAEHRLRFIFSFFGIIDLLVILPFYLQFAVDLRSLRVFWLFRLFRLFKLVRYVDAAKRIADAFRMVWIDLAIFGIGALFVFYLASVGIYFFEREAQPESFASVPHAFWWALATLTTVGYGDVYPITVGGKVFTFFVLMLGLGVFAVPTGLIVMAIISTRESIKNTKDE
ncbi:MAG: ion transporter [Pseudomonadota bacterium]